MYSTTLDTSSEESSSSSSQGMTSSSTENTDSADSEETTTTQEISDHKSSGTTVGALPTTPNQINTHTGNLYLITAPTNVVNYRYYRLQLGIRRFLCLILSALCLYRRITFTLSTKGHLFGRMSRIFYEFFKPIYM